MNTIFKTRLDNNCLVHSKILAYFSPTSFKASQVISQSPNMNILLEL